MPKRTPRPKGKYVRDIKISIILGVVLTALSYLAGIIFGWISGNDIRLLEVFAVFTSYSCTYLCVVERRINYPIGAISSAAYAYLFYKSGLLASTILNAYLVPTLIYGWLRWRKDINTRPVAHIGIRWMPVYLLVAGLGYSGAALLSRHFGGAMAWTDSVILAGTILAQFLLDNKKLENWIVWAIVNIFAIYTYATTGLPLVAAQYVLFLGNTVYGYIIWNRSKHYAESIHSNDGHAANYGALAAYPVR
jgi:nicotinamide mononucleotide transporter